MPQTAFSTPLMYRPSMNRIEDESIDVLRGMPELGAPKLFKNPVLAGLRAWPVKGFQDILVFTLFSLTHAGGHIVVTHEVPSASTRKIKIPGACIGLGVKRTAKLHSKQ
jgi:hypothetical protein